MVYFKSTLTKQVYAGPSFPQYMGYSPVTRQEYEAWCKEHHIVPIKA